MYVCMHIHVYMYGVYMYVCACMYVCMYECNEHLGFCSGIQG